ncbi:hypothetical protein N8D56_05110 [Devosia sp. A8/3-2]|nr:hypothetical protein N8D56_05110 [Devosia sp. A8/3-2]
MQYRVDGGVWTALTGVGTGVRVIAGLTDGVEYDIDIRAGNSVGFGLASDVKSATPIYIEPSNIKLLFDGSDLLAGGTAVDEAPGAPALILGSTAVVVDGGIQVGGSTGDVRFPNREGFTFDGLFTVKMRFTKANWNRSAGPDFLVSFWLSTNNQRARLISVSATNTILGGFGNGGGASGNVVDTVPNASIPVPIPAGLHELMFDRGADNYTRVYLDGVMVGKSAAPVPGTNVNNGTNFVRVTGSASGNNDPGPSILHFLEVRKGEALCGSDAGYTP